MIAKLFVGYRTRLAAGFEDYMPEFRAPTNYRDADKIQAYVADKQEEFKATAKDMPYTGTFDCVVIADPVNEKVVQFDYRAPESGKQPICLAVRTYLMQHWKTAWADDTHGKDPTAVFVGFNPRTFLKILGLECSLPHVGAPLPLRLWYSNSDNRDIANALVPEEFRNRLSMAQVLRARRPPDKDREAQAAWDELTKDWPGPGERPRQDVEIAIELATQLGMLKV